MNDPVEQPGRERAPKHQTEKLDMENSDNKAGQGCAPTAGSRIRVVLWFRHGWDHWKGPWAFKRNVTSAVLWSLSLGGIEIRRQVVGTWGIANTKDQASEGLPASDCSLLDLENGKES